MATHGQIPNSAIINPGSALIRNAADTAWVSHAIDKVDNTSDVDKPISNATQTALDNKVDKVTGKGLSANDYTDTAKDKLDGIENGAQVNAVDSVNTKTGAVVLDHADVGADAAGSASQALVDAKDYADNAVEDFSETLATVAVSGSYDDLTDTPIIPAAQVNSDWNANSGVSQILNKPTLSTVATSGSYNDLSNKPTIPSAQVNSDWDATSGVSQILNKPTVPKFITLSGTTTSGNVTFDVSSAGFTSLTAAGCIFRVNDSNNDFSYQTTSVSNTSVTLNVKRREFTGVTVLSINVIGSTAMNNVPNGTTVFATFIGV